MKVLFGFCLLACAVVALVDEQTATGSVPESKKTDLLITANGQTIKINTDAPRRQAAVHKAVRFNLKQKFIRVKTRKAQDEPTEPVEPTEPTGEPTGEESVPADENSLDEELSELASVINGLTELRAANPTSEASIEISAQEVDKILDLLENYEEILKAGSAEAAPQAPIQEEEAQRRRRSRVQVGYVKTFRARTAPIKRPSFVPLRHQAVRKWFVSP